MKKIIAALAVASMMAMPQAMATDGDRDGDMTRIVAVASLNVRSSAVVGDNVVGVLSFGEKVEVENKSADGLWCRVDVPSRGWNDVYVSCRFLGFKSGIVSGSSHASGWINIDGVRVVGVPALNVRSSAAIANNLIGFLSLGDRVHVISKSPDHTWCKIKFDRNGREHGYVVCRLLMHPAG